MRRLANLQERVSGLTKGVELIRRIAYRFNGDLTDRGPDDYLFSFDNEDDAKGFMDELEKTIADIDWEGPTTGTEVYVYVPMGAADRFTGEADPMDEDVTGKKLKAEMKFKDGTSFPSGTEVSVRFDKSLPSAAFITAAGAAREYRVSASRLHKYLAGFTKPPSVTTMAKWSEDGVAKSITGHRVELDGYGPDGSPAWTLVAGVI